MTLEDRILELEDRVAQLEAELGLSQSSTRIEAVRRLGLKPTTAKVVLAIYDAGGKVVTHQFLEEEILDSAHVYSEGITKVHVCLARKVLGKQAIRTSQGYGFYMLEDGRAVIERALQGMAA